MKNLIIKDYLDEKALEMSRKYFNLHTGANWNKDQYVKSLKNQDYIKFLVFYKNDEIVGIIDYTYDNPWKEKKMSIEYYENDEIKEYMREYVNNILNSK